MRQQNRESGPCDAFIGERSAVNENERCRVGVEREKERETAATSVRKKRKREKGSDIITRSELPDGRSRPNSDRKVRERDADDFRMIACCPRPRTGFNVDVSA